MSSMMRFLRRHISPAGILVVLAAAIFTAGCGGKDDDSQARRESERKVELMGDAPPCDFAGGPEDAKVKVVAYYPGRHEDTLEAVKSLLETFPGKARVEIVDWRSEEGLARRDAAGLVCAGITVNGEHAFEIDAEGGPYKVLFVRAIGGEWSKADLEAAVRQELVKADAN